MRLGDATDIVIVEGSVDLRRRWKMVVELRNIPFDQQRDVLFWLLDRVPNFRKGAMDRGGNGAYLAEKATQRYGSRKGLRYDRIHEQGEPLGEMLRAIAGAGRASPRHDGIRWTVVIDRERDQVIDHLSPRNCSDVRWRREYLDPPHAVRVKFNDETDDWEEAERIIRWPGYAGPISLTEEMVHPGKTNPDEIYLETRRRMHEIGLRPDTFTCYQAGAARTATRGDRVHVSHPVLTRTQVAARVRRVEGALVELDAPVTMEAGSAYGLGYRVFADAEDTVGGAQVAEVAFEAGPTHLLRLRAVTDLPAVGAIVHFGLRGEESHDMIVTGIEPAKDFGAQLTLKLAAPEIEALTDAEVVPDWAVTVGDPISVTTTPPLAPRFTEIDSANASGLDDPGTGAAWFEQVVAAPDPYVIIRLAPGAGETAQISHYRLFHRLQGAGTWTELLIWAADAGTQLETYQRGDLIELQAVAVAFDATEGAATSVVTHTVGADATALPAVLDEETITITGGLGHARIELAVSASATRECVHMEKAQHMTVDVPRFNALGRRATEAMDWPRGRVAPAGKVSAKSRRDAEASMTTQSSHPGQKQQVRLQPLRLSLAI